MSYKHKNSKKMAAGIIALSVLMSSPAYAAESTANSSTNPTTPINTTSVTDTSSRFTDVPAQHWALKHITKLAALGIIQGVDKGKFSPDTQVSQQDVIIMAIRMMGLESEALKNKSETILPVSVDSYAKPYVAYAFDKELINVKEESDGTGTSKSSWGSRPATREWVAKLVIRAIDKQDLANLKNADPSIFSDAKDMSSWAVGYINAAVSLKIVNGVDDNNFQPKGNVTRAQMATFLSRADKELTTRSDRVTIGYLMELKDRKLTLLSKEGKGSQYTVATDVVIYNAKDDSRIPASSLKETNEVYVIQEQGNVTYIELTNDAEQMETLEGTLNKVYVDKMLVDITQGGEESLKDLEANVAVTDKDGRGLSLSSIQPGSMIVLKRNLLIPGAKYSKIIVKQVPVSKTAEGSVATIQDQDNTITFLEQSTTQNETYPFAARVAVTLPDGTAGDLSKIRVGDTVKYTVKANEVTAVTITKQADIGATVQGTLMTDTKEDTKTITITKSDGSLGAYYIADNASVSIEGLATAGVLDLEVGDMLQLDLVNNKVVKATVTSRSIVEQSFATIDYYDATKKQLYGTLTDGKGFAYKLTTSTAISSWDIPVELDDFESKFMRTKGTKVDLKVSTDKVLSVKLSTQAVGTVSQVNATANQITIRTNGGQNITFNVVSGATVNIFSKSGSKLSDLQVGDLVVGEMNRDQDVINMVSVKKTAVYKVLRTDTSARELEVQDENGATLKFSIATDERIVNPGKSTHAFTDIAVDDYVKVAYTGITLNSVELLNTVHGKVTNVDSAKGIVTVQDYAGTVQAFSVGKQFTVKQNGTSSAVLGNIKSNDRVEIVNAGDKMIISIAAASKRTVAGYDNVLNRLQMKPNTAGDKTNYNLYAKAYIHQGTTPVAVSSFVENDEVTLYVLDDKIIEIEK
ncbi:S-layer homology domain-containing protein [Paenibacillus rigui]|uniref:S-layer protein n=1 Tax=Paenibacillus rigui TaxID=554312 RepID=A0A229UX18_9BACL|nr:S-layer homology domain-containing protein [Paenibacillus rigui]OXM88022.1 S-layer protein [Paenibacillus rigui]